MGFVFGLWIGLILGCIAGIAMTRELFKNGIRKIINKRNNYYDYYKDREIL